MLMTGLHGGPTSVQWSFGKAHLSDSDVKMAEMLKRAVYAAGTLRRVESLSRGEPGTSAMAGPR